MVRKKSPFPNAPVCGFWSDLQAAAADYAAVLQQTPELLAAHRAGVDAAGNDLVLGYRWLVYLASRDSRWDEDNVHGYGYRNDLWGTMGEILTDAVQRLRTGKKKAKTLTDVDSYLRSELSRAPGIFRREISENLLVPRSTKATLKRNNQPEAQPLKRQQYIQQKDGRLIEPFKILETPAPKSDPRLDVADTPLEQLVWGLVRAGMSERDIAASTGQKLHAVKKIKTAMIGRVRIA